MKLRTLIFAVGSILVALPLSGIGFMPWLKSAKGPAGGGGPAGYEFTETFEGSTVDDQSNVGYDNSGWTSYQPGAANNPHYATSPAPLVGSYSLRTATDDLANVGRTTGYTASGTFGVYCILNVPTVWLESHVIWLRNSSDVVVLALRLKSDDGIFQIGDQQIIDTGVTADASGYNLSTTYHIWLEYIKGTGAN
jgi:hypothetical protein